MSFTEVDDGSLEIGLSFSDKDNEPGSFHFAICEGKGRIQIPLKLESVPLPRR